MASSRLRNFHHQLVDAVGRDIATGTYPEGEQMPTEPQLAEAYGASRMVVREAMKSLAAKGMVSIRPRTGTHVLPRAQWHLFDPAVLSWHDEADFDSSLLGDLLELRLAIEPLAARLAAARASEKDLIELRSAYDAMTGAGKRSDYIEADLRFHSAVVQACGNVFIQQLGTALSAVWKTSFQASSSATGAPDSAALKLHQKLLLAIEKNDAAGAEKAVHGLIARATTRIEGRTAG
ncbi:FadR/GntR family transcriptional regulator [Hydrogenophaga sp.]|uniref:FadR/GntR family transcriptional regulator n=1 Tax=Hydrogenophaga sp. TaxID=1904254 RepID=UPI0027207D59|nr:FadR/GntR family transcriptional regulator [Hydrogenophaga sp.]MDO9433904.1 FadR/GntR family transcriptional regulator [Hydrogenophaga sp.]